MKVTVFTPTYNRAHLLRRVYTSLCNQTFTDFEWILVNDGSTDNTAEVIQSFIDEKKIQIRYFFQQNAGKHIAINKAASVAKGDYFLILDSDDFLPRDSLFLLNKLMPECDEDNELAGIVGRKHYEDGTLIGSKIGANFKGTTFDIRFKRKIKGDLGEIFKTEVFKKFPFPEIENEKFCPESLVWNRISRNFKFIFSDINIYTVEYQPDGLTSNIVKIRMNAPVATMIYYSELTQDTIPFTQKIKANINFWRFAFNSNKSFGYKWKLSKGVFLGIFIPVGYAMYCRDKIHNPNK
jgi:glycosyltransferase involved in cell wall biosynthesis